MNKNSTLRNKMVSLSFVLLAALAPACGDDSSAAKTGGFGLATQTGTKNGTMTVNMGGAAKPGGTTSLGALAGPAPGGQAAAPGGQPTAPGGQPTAPGGQPTAPGGQPTAPAQNTRMHDAAAASALVGTWSLQQGTCALMLIFQQARMAVVEGCEMDDGTIGVEIQEGNYTVQGSTITLTGDAYTCGSRPRGATTATFNLAGSTLTIVPEGGQTMTLTRGEATLKGNQAVPGCLNPEGFTPSTQ